MILRDAILLLTLIHFIKVLIEIAVDKGGEDKNSYVGRTVSRAAEDLCFPDTHVSGKKNIAIEKALLTPDPLSRHALVAFRDGQRTRVGFAQKFKFEFKSPRARRGIKGDEWDVESEVKKDLTPLVEIV